MDAWPFRSGAFAHLVIEHAREGDQRRAYHYFWRMLDSIRALPAGNATKGMQDAVGALCHGGKRAGLWAWEDIPQTMERAQTLIAHLEARGVDADEMRRLHLMHPILAAAYVEHAMHQSHKAVQQMVRAFADENPVLDVYVAHVYTHYLLNHPAVPAVDRLRLFARDIHSLDQYVGVWGYLIGSFEQEEWEAVIRSALEQAEVEERTTLEWLLAILREQQEHEAPGIHLARLGFIPELCWLVAGPFEGEHLSTPEEARLLTALSQNNGQDLDSRGIKHAGTSHLPLLRFSPIPPFTSMPRVGNRACGLEWRVAAFADDFRDGYLDCRRMFGTGARVCAYAWAVLESPADRKVFFQIGHNDQVSVWLNGDLRFKRTGPRSVIMDDESFSGSLRPGVNHLLVRMTSTGWGQGFILRVRERSD